jgi:3',5'-cyclic-AMP phosphodiesterase
MPSWYEPKISRQSFLRISTALFAGGIASRYSFSSNDTERERLTRFTLLSDTHIPANKDEEYRGFRPYKNLETVLGQIPTTNPQMALLCGDAARLAGLVDDYQALKTILTEHNAPPTAIALGNHDDRDNFRRVFEPATNADTSVSGKHISIVEAAHVRWVVLDSLLYVDRVAGLLGKAQRNWLANYLAAHTDKPTLLMVHHTLGDEDGELLDASFLKQLAAQNSHVQAIFYGHSHVFDIKKHEHVHLVNLPAVGYNFSDKQPVGWMSAQTAHDNITLTLHTIGGDESQNGKSFELKFS